MSKKPVKKVQEPEFNLSRLIPILKQRSTLYEKTNSVYTSITKEKRKNDVIVTKIKIKISADIIDKLDWQEGDLISIYHDPEYMRKFYFILSSSGYKLFRQSEDHYTLEFPWRNNEVILDSISGKKVEHTFVKSKADTILSIVI
jgi:hypothetical protein